MQSIDESKLVEDIQYRYEFLADFIGFTAEDVSAIQQFAPHLGPRIGELVEQTYEKLLNYDITARHFMQPQHGCDAATAPDLAQLDANDPQIRFRKDHLQRYFLQLIGRAYDAKMVLYLDMVGKIHTAAAGNDLIQVPLVQMNALMGLLSDMLLSFVADAAIDEDAKHRTQRAFTKLLWIQNDFIQRHYV